MNIPIYRDAFGMQYRLKYSRFDKRFYIQRTYGPYRFCNFMTLHAKSQEEAEAEFRQFIDGREAACAVH